MLKTLEEPPKHAVFILATTEKHKVLPTILSRCQIFNFNRIVSDDIASHLHGIAEKENVKRLVEGYNPQKIYETLPTSEYTAYSENKGEKLAFCLDTEKNSGGRLIDINTLTYVALHELSHVATKSIGHTDEFWSNFKFIISI